MRFFSSRYCVAIEYGVATAGLVAMIFNIELVVAIFCSLRCHVNIEFRVATIRFVAKFFFFQYRADGCDFFVRCDCSVHCDVLSK